MTTCEAVIAESCARLAYFASDQRRVLDLVLNGSLVLDFSAARNMERICRLMKKYEDQPMDFADAYLVVMTEKAAQSVVVTLDRGDFLVYRQHERGMIPVITPGQNG